MKISRLLSRTIALTALTTVGAGAAYAQSITPVFVGTGGVAGNITYTYGLFITADTRTVPGDIFTFYDFNGLLTGGGNGPVFTPDLGTNPTTAYNISVQNTGLNPPNTVAIGGDDPGQPNVSLTNAGFTYTNPGGGPQHLGDLTIHSIFGPNLTGDFTPFAASFLKNSNSSPAGNQGQVTGPNAAPVTPEPGTWAMLAGMGVTGLAAVRRRRRK
jgi:hypothetical protein